MSYDDKHLVQQLMEIIFLPPEVGVNGHFYVAEDSWSTNWFLHARFLAFVAIKAK